MYYGEIKQNDHYETWLEKITGMYLLPEKKKILIVIQQKQPNVDLQHRQRPSLLIHVMPWHQCDTKSLSYLRMIYCEIIHFEQIGTSYNKNRFLKCIWKMYQNNVHFTRYTVEAS